MISLLVGSVPLPTQLVTYTIMLFRFFVKSNCAARLLSVFVRFYPVSCIFLCFLHFSGRVAIGAGEFPTPFQAIRGDFEGKKQILCKKST